MNSEYQSRVVDPAKKRAMRILKGNASFEDRFFADHDEFLSVVGELRSMDCIIAFTTGVWDLFHIGHGDYMQKGKDEAKKLYPESDVVLVVGVDTDELTRSRKGPTRPIVPENERIRVLGHVRAVDIIVPQYEPNQLFNILPHDVRIVSESTKDLPELEKIKSRCEHLVNLPPQAETSTTARIRRLMLDGSHETLERVTKKLLAVIEEARNELQG